MLRKSKVLFFSLVACISLSHAEDDGGFFTVGYELGQVMQDVKNPGKAKADYLMQQLNSGVTLNVAGQDIGGNVVGSLGNAFSTYLNSFLKNYIQYTDQDKLVKLPVFLWNTLNTSSQNHAGTCNGKSYQAGSNPCDVPFINSVEKMLNGSNPNSLVSKILSVTQPGITTYPQLINQIAYFQSLPLFLQNLNGVLDGEQLGNISEYGKGGNEKAILKLEQEYCSSISACDPTNDNSRANVSKEALQALTQQITGMTTQVAQSLNAATSGMSKISDSVLDSATALASLDAIVSGSNPSTAELTGLVQQVIDVSKQTQKLLQNAYNESLKGSGTINNQVATNLPSALANVENTITKLQNLNNEVRDTPYLPQFRAGNSRQTNIMNGFYTKWGYKQFFGKKRNIGLRYYGFFSYNGASVGFRDTYNNVGLYTYGVGTDVLYNIFERSY
ncbi:outer membrane beta-barrel protein, partial [Helicobacter cetorum]|uniref:outer membrane beta-barrel protein n=1 Tax=Helicobacter cetorum TaxID=138563 RepID=UPI000CF0D957